MSSSRDNTNENQIIHELSAEISKNPKNGAAYLNRAIAYEKQAKYDLAMEDYKQAKNLAPELTKFIKPLREEAARRPLQIIEAKEFNSLVKHNVVWIICHLCLVHLSIF